MLIEDIVVKKVVKTQSGEKTYWNKVGVLKTTDDGKRYIELFMFPTTGFYVFEQKKKEDEVDL